MSHQSQSTQTVQSGWLSLGVAMGVGVAVGAGMLSLFKGGQSPRQSPQRKVQDSDVVRESTDDESEELLREQLTRNISFLGEEGFMKVRKSFIVVVGVGGVGSHAAHMLARSGVERLRVIDFDQVTLSSLNRHAVATLEDVGQPKVKVLEKHFRRIIRACKVEAIVSKFDGSLAPKLLSGSPTFVLDCIDDLTTKVELLKYCHENKIPVVSSMGAGARVDPSRLQIGDISETAEDPLSRVTRRMLRKAGIDSGVPVVYSSERPKLKLLPMEEHQNVDPDQFRPLPDFRIRVLPVLGTMPAIFGMAMASYVVAEISGFGIKPVAVADGRNNFYTKLLTSLVSREMQTFKSGKPDLSIPDIRYLVEEVFKGKSAISQRAHGLILCRFDPTKPAAINNTVLLTRGEAEKHMAGQQEWPEGLKERIGKLLNDAPAERPTRG